MIVPVVQSRCEHEYVLAHEWEKLTSHKMIRDWLEERQIQISTDSLEIRLHLLCQYCYAQRERNLSKQVYHAIMGTRPTHPSPDEYREIMFRGLLPDRWWQWETEEPELDV